jgi:hypothetical protein
LEHIRKHNWICVDYSHVNSFPEYPSLYCYFQTPVKNWKEIAG